MTPELIGKIALICAIITIEWTRKEIKRINKHNNKIRDLRKTYQNTINKKQIHIDNTMRHVDDKILKYITSIELILVIYTIYSVIT